MAELTIDHVPPRNLFPKPRPSNLITVPACRNCNKSFELDDEYFRLAVTTGIDPEVFPREFQMSIQAINKLKDPRKVGFAREMLSSFSKRPRYTPSGLYVGHAGALEIDVTRIENVASRVIRGLFFHHTNRRVATGNQVSVFLGQFPGDTKEHIGALNEVFAALCTQPMRVIGERVFRYSYLLDVEFPDNSAWWLSFYEHRNLIGVTLGADNGVL